MRAPHEAACGQLDRVRVSVINEVLHKVADESLQFDRASALLVLPDLSEDDGARTESGLLLGALRINDGHGRTGRLRADGLSRVLATG
jgi:hypothetical protein